MSFRVEIEITPDADGVHCGECGELRWGDDNGWTTRCRHYEAEDIKRTRCPACLAAEKAWREKNP